jgi:hypothetical protein
MLRLMMEWAHSSKALVGGSAFLATFVASVMADEQNARLRQGTFGAIAGASVGGLAAIMQKEGDLLLVGVFGSACGALFGWIVYLGLSLVASTRWGRRLVEYLVSGLAGVRARIDLEDRNLLLKALTVWSQNFRGMVLRESQIILANPLSQEYSRWVSVALRGWLTSLVDAFNLVLDALAEKSEYRSRITIIVFGHLDGDQVVGRHWLSYAGARRGHKRKDFPTKSVAYEVLVNEKSSPCFMTTENATGEGQDRGGKGYSSFYVFRLNDHAVLSLDWPGKIPEDDDYIRIAHALLYLDVAPAVGSLLDRWPVPLAAEVGLTPLSQRGPLAQPLIAAPGTAETKEVPPATVAVSPSETAAAAVAPTDHLAAVPSSVRSLSAPVS